MKPLDDLLVLDLSRVLSGPFCTQALGDMGARIIKVEQPGSGDDTRGFGPPFLEGESTYFMSANRNKESITLNLKAPEGRQILEQLLAKADIVVENFRAGVMDRLGFGYEVCHARFPRLIYCAISGFGHVGEQAWVERPGYDLVIQGMGGLQSTTGALDTPPFKSGVPIADLISGMLATQGILLALIARGRTGRGQKVDISMLDGQVSLLTFLSGIYFATGRIPGRVGNRHPSICPYATYQARDGYLNLAVGNDSLWKAFAQAAGLESLLQSPDSIQKFGRNASRVSNREELDAMIVPILRSDTVAGWIARLEKAGIPCGPVLSIQEVLEHPQVRARDMVVGMDHPKAGAIRLTGVPVKLSETPGGVVKPPPTLGQHTDALLHEMLGLDADTLARLRAAGVV